MRGPIVGIPKSERVDRRGERLPSCWIERPQDAPLPALGGAEAAVRAALEAGPVLLALLGPRPPEEALAVLRQAAVRRARIYALCAPGPGANALIALAPGAPVLLRRLPGLPGAALLSARGEQGLLWLGQRPTEPQPLCLTLDGAQGEALFALLTHLFWHEAKEEALAEGTWRRVGEGPVGLVAPQPPADAAVSTAGGPLSPAALWLDPDGLLPEAGTSRAVPRHILVPPAAQGLEALEKLRRDGATVAWQSWELPALALGPDAGVVAARGERFTLRVRLSAGQAKRIHDALCAVLPAARFQFCVQPTLGEIESQRASVWRSGGGCAQPLEPLAQVDCGAVTAETLCALREGAVSVPRKPPPELALTVEYRWELRPPQVPPGAKPDPLHGEWKALDHQVAQRCQSARTRLERLAEQEGTLGKRFEGLRALLLGIGRRREELQRRLKELDAFAPSALQNPVDALERLQRLDQFEKDLSHFAKTVAEEEQRERRAQQEQAQRAEWERRRREAEDALSRCQREREERERELEEVEQALGAAPEGESKKDRKARQKKLRDEADRLRKKLAGLEAEIARHGETLGEEFRFQPPPATACPGAQATGALFVPPPTEQGPKVPRESLPAVGRLWRTQNRRYLAIDCWEDLPQAEAEAARLGATLVAKEQP